MRFDTKRVKHTGGLKLGYPNSNGCVSITVIRIHYQGNNNGCRFSKWDKANPTKKHRLPHGMQYMPIYDDVTPTDVINDGVYVCPES